MLVFWDTKEDFTACVIVLLLRITICLLCFFVCCVMLHFAWKSCQSGRPAIWEGLVGRDRRLLTEDDCWCWWFLNIKYKWFTFWEGLLCRDPRILTEDDCVVFLDMRHLSAEYLVKNKPMLFVVKPHPPSSHGSFSFFNKDVVLLLKYEVYHVLGLKPNTNVFLLFQVLGQKPSPHICQLIDFTFFGLNFIGM